MTDGFQKDIRNLEKSASCFHDRLFTQCKSLANQIVSRESRTSPYIEWVAENNVLAAEYQLKMLKDKGHSSAEFQVQFQNLLKKISSLPLTSDITQLELSVLYNCVVIRQQGTTGGVGDSPSIITESLNRLAAKCGVSYTENIPYLLEKLSSKTDEYKGILQVCLLLAVGSVRSGALEMAQQILAAITITPGYRTHHESESSRHPAEFTVKLQQGSPPLTREDGINLIHILLASCKLAEEKLSDSKNCLQKANITKFKSVAVYVNALRLQKEQNSGEALTALQQLTTSDLESTESSLRARIQCLTGRCLAEVGKPQTAIHHLKSALELDFKYVVPLYHIAELYKQMHLENAELEALNLLTLSLENSPSAHVSDVQTLKQMVVSTIMTLLDAPCTISVIEVQYLLAARCLQLHRNEAAYQRFVDLLAMIINSDAFQTKGKLITVPGLHQIFVEAIQASLRCSRYVDCITLCDQALVSVHEHVMSDQPQHLTVPTSLTETSGSGKRKRVQSSEVENEEISLISYITEYLLYKSEALQQQGELEESVQTLHSALGRLEERIFAVTPGVNLSAVGGKQPVKRARLSSDAVNPPSLQSTGNPHQSLSHVYSRLGSLSSLQDKHNKAIHYYRLSLQVDKENKTTCYHLTKELFIMKRVQDGVSCWLESRSINPKMDTYQINREIYTRESRVRNLKRDGISVCPVEENMKIPNEIDILEMDIQVLKALLCHRQSHVWKIS